MSESPSTTLTAEPTFTPLERHHDRAAFACARHPVLATYVHRQALQDRDKGAAAPVALIDSDGRTIIGYCTLSGAEVDLDRIPPAVGRKLPRYPKLPAIRLGRLAVADAYLGQRYGEALLMNALDRAEAGSHAVAATFLIVDAKDQAAIDFYLRYDFHPFPDNPNQLFLTLAEVRAALGR